jgi:hypothetical protein
MLGEIRAVGQDLEEKRAAARTCITSALRLLRSRQP